MKETYEKKNSYQEKIIEAVRKIDNERFLKRIFVSLIGYLEFENQPD